MPKSTVIKGKRIFLRVPTAKDLTEYLVLNRRSASFNRGLASPPTRPEQFANFLKRRRRETDVCFFVCRQDDGAILGSINLSQIFRGGFQSAYLGYHIGAEFAKQGYMTEAIGSMLRYAFRELKLHRMEANPGTLHQSH